MRGETLKGLNYVEKYKKIDIINPRNDCERNEKIKNIKLVDETKRNNGRGNFKG